MTIDNAQRLEIALDAFLELCSIPYVESVDPRKALAAAIEAYLASLPQGEVVAVPVEPTDPSTIIAGIRQFGLAADGSDLRALEAAMLAAAPASPSPSAPAMEPVAVKPLEWTENDWNGAKSHEAKSYGQSYWIFERGAACDVICQADGWTKSGLPSLVEAKAAAQADYESRIRPALVAPPTPSSLDARTVEAAVVAGWNACRKSLYAVCEDIQEQADALRISAPVTTAAAEQHSKGYHAGSNFAAKSIARGFNSMEAMDDDNALAALRSLTQETTK